MSYARGIYALIFSVALIAAFTTIYYIMGFAFLSLPSTMTAPLVSGVAIIIFYVTYDFMGDSL